jgi:methylmalonyl-CoA mutase N-terminal domain/subunit
MIFVTRNKVLNKECLKKCLAQFKSSYKTSENFGGEKGSKKLISGNILTKPVYSKSDLDSSDELPGIYPFTRGPHATMYTFKPWDIRQHINLSLSQDVNYLCRKVSY